MRSHGVTNFPDPSGSGAADSENTIFGIAVPSNIDLQAPAVQAATHDCVTVITGSGPRPTISSQQRSQMIAHAQCMREHGVPQFPDPIFTNKGIEIFDGPGVNPQSPAFQKAQKSCGSGA